MNCRCKNINKRQQDYLSEIAKLSIESCFGGKYTLSNRIFFRPCCEYLDDEFEEVFGTTDLSEIKTCQYDDALDFIAEWFPPDIVMELSEQMEADFAKYRYRYVEDMPEDSPAYQQLMEDFINAVCSGTERPY